MNSKVELRELLSNKTTTIDNNSTDTEYPTAKAVYDNCAPIGATKYVGIFKVPDDCIVPFEFHRVLNMANERATAEGLFVSRMTDPVDGSSGLFGDLKVRQQCYGGSTAGSATNICIEQTFDTYLKGSPTQRKVFFRRGYLADSATDIDINNVEAIKNSLTWMSWYPIDYPQINLSGLLNTTDFSGGYIVLTITSGVALFELENIEPRSTSIKDIIVSTAFSKYSKFFKSNARATLGNARNPLNGGILTVRANRNSSLTCIAAGTAGNNYNGQLVVTLGY